MFFLASALICIGDAVDGAQATLQVDQDVPTQDVVTQKVGGENIDLEVPQEDKPVPETDVQDTNIDEIASSPNLQDEIDPLDDSFFKTWEVFSSHATKIESRVDLIGCIKWENDDWEPQEAGGTSCKTKPLTNTNKFTNYVLRRGKGTKYYNIQLQRHTKFHVGDIDTSSFYVRKDGMIGDYSVLLEACDAYYNCEQVAEYRTTYRFNPSDPGRPIMTVVRRAQKEHYALHGSSKFHAALTRAAAGTFQLQKEKVPSRVRFEKDGNDVQRANMNFHRKGWRYEYTTTIYTQENCVMMLRGPTATLKGFRQIGMKFFGPSAAPDLHSIDATLKTINDIIKKCQSSKVGKGGEVTLNCLPSGLVSILRRFDGPLIFCQTSPCGPNSGSDVHTASAPPSEEG